MEEHLINDLMTVTEVATDLRVSRGHVYHLINGTVTGINPLPCLQLGRRKLIRRSSLEAWKEANDRARISSTEQHAVRA